MSSKLPGHQIFKVQGTKDQRGSRKVFILCIFKWVQCWQNPITAYIIDGDIFKEADVLPRKGKWIIVSNKMRILGNSLHSSWVKLAINLDMFCKRFGCLTFLPSNFFFQFAVGRKVKRLTSRKLNFSFLQRPTVPVVYWNMRCLMIGD